MRFSPRHRLLSAALAAAFGTALASWSGLAAAQGADQAAAQARDINVPAQPLGAALNELSRQTGVQVLAAGDVVSGLAAPAVSGRLSFQQALDRLLAGSGLVAVRNGPTRVTIQRQSTAGASTLPAVTVAAQAATDGTTEGTGSYTTRAAAGATRMDLSLRETPQSVSVIGRQQIDDQNLVTLEDVLRQTPGIVADRNDERVTFSSRGFALSTMIDGVPTLGFNSVAGESSMISTAFYDRVEVIRGAAGLLNGVGSPGGAINLVRKRPTSEFAGHISGGIGSWSRYNAEIDVGGPLNADGTVRGRFMASRTDGKSFIENKKRSEDALYGILEVDLAAGSRLSVGFEHQKTAIDGANYGQSPLFFSNGQRTNLPRSFNSSAPWSYWDMYSDKLFANLDQRLGAGWQLKVDASYLKSKRERASGDLSIYRAINARTGASTIDIRENPAEGANKALDVHLKGPFEAFGQTHEAVVGMSYNTYDATVYTRGAVPRMIDRRPLNFYQLQSFPEPTSFSYPLYTAPLNTTEKAIYASTRLKLAEPLSLIVGARGTWYKSDASTLDWTTWRRTGVSSMRENGVVTPYLGVVFDVSKELSLYGSYTDIFQPNTVRDRNNSLIAPQRGKNIELGLKGEHFGGKLNTSAAIFKTRETNLAVIDTGAGSLLPDGGIPYRAVQGAKSKGFELTAAGEVLPGLQMLAGYTYHAKRDADGVLLNPQYPRRLFRVATSYRLPGEWSKLTIGGSMSYQSGIYYDEFNELGRASQGGLTLFGLMARYDINNRLSASLHIENLGDKRYYNGLGAYNGYTQGNPRNAWLKLSYKL
ncbi:Ferric-pseudobactin receptor precursor [compost metagenome]